MKRLLGRFVDHLEVNEDLSVDGILLAGARIREGRTLFVRGNMRGTVALEMNARLVVAGTFGAYVDENHGLLAIAGEVSTPLELIPGTLVIAGGTAVVLNSLTKVVSPDGNLEPVAEMNDVTLGSADVLLWEPNDSRFEPHTSHDFQELVRQLF